MQICIVQVAYSVGWVGPPVFKMNQIYQYENTLLLMYHHNLHVLLILDVPGQNPLGSKC